MGRVASFLLLGGFLTAGQPVGKPLSMTTPAAAPGRAVLASWQKIAGEAETATETVSYELYVNPARDGLYEVTRYRLTHVAGAASSSESEKFLWNAHPGAHNALRCFQLTASGRWDEIAAGSHAYRHEMGVAMYVYELHRKSLGL